MLRVHEAAKLLGVSTSTIRNYTKKGLLTASYTPSGQRIYNQEEVEQLAGKTQPQKIAHYARSTSGNQELINNQLQELTQKYGQPDYTYKDSGSGLNENRKGLHKLIKDAQDGKYTTLCITYQDRLTRFGYTYLKTLLEQNNVTIEVLHPNTKHSAEEELLQDFMSLIASFSGKFYRLRSTESKRKLLARAEKELSS